MEKRKAKFISRPVMKNILSYVPKDTCKDITDNGKRCNAPFRYSRIVKGKKYIKDCFKYCISDEKKCNNLVTNILLKCFTNKINGYDIHSQKLNIYNTEGHRISIEFDYGSKNIQIHLIIFESVFNNKYNIDIVNVDPKYICNFCKDVKRMLCDESIDFITLKAFVKSKKRDYDRRINLGNNWKYMEKVSGNDREYDHHKFGQIIYISKQKKLQFELFDESPLGIIDINVDSEIIDEKFAKKIRQFYNKGLNLDFILRGEERSFFKFLDDEGLEESKKVALELGADPNFDYVEQFEEDYDNFTKKKLNYSEDNYIEEDEYLDN